MTQYKRYKKVKPPLRLYFPVPPPSRHITPGKSGDRRIITPCLTWTEDNQGEAGLGHSLVTGQLGRALGTWGTFILYTYRGNIGERLVHLTILM